MSKKKLTLLPSPELYARDGLIPDVIAPWEDGQRCSTDRGFFEWWYFDAHFDDGSTAVIVFASKPLLERRGPLKPCLRINITTPDGRELGGFPAYPPEAFSAAHEACDVRIEHSWVRGDLHHYEMHAEQPGLSADLEFNGIVPPWRPGTGKNYYDEDQQKYFGWLPSIPYGTVSGMLTYDGVAHPVSGSGYHDHNWGNVDLNSVMSHWYWGRAHVGDYSLIFVEMNTVKDYASVKIPVFLLAKGDQILVGDSAPLKMEARDFVSHPSGRSYPNVVDFNWQSGPGCVKLALRGPEIIEASSLLSLLPLWQQRIARLIANPYYFRFNSNLQLDIDLPGEKTSVQGRALFEIMMLR